MEFIFRGLCFLGQFLLHIFPGLYFVKQKQKSGVKRIRIWIIVPAA